MRSRVINVHRLERVGDKINEIQRGKAKALTRNSVDKAMTGSVRIRFQSQGR